jgi:hypothetical protein
VRLGSGDNGEFTFLDTISLTSFLIGLMNLEENLTQGDKQELMEELSKKADLLLSEIHSHLEAQDEKIDEILRRLQDEENRKNDGTR